MFVPAVRANVGVFDLDLDWTGLCLTPMPRNLKRYSGEGDLHFITFSCYRRLPLLASAAARNQFVRVLDEVRVKYGFPLVGFTVMPEHVHLLIGESAQGTPSTVIHNLKLKVSKRLRRGEESKLPRFWYPRFYDFNIYKSKKIREKLEYMHSNPVTRGLVEDPIDWAWSSYPFYSGRGTPMIKIDFVL